MSVQLTRNRQLFSVIALVLTADLAILLDVPLLRPLLALISLTILPGFLIFKILNPAGINRLEGILFTVGLGISFAMFFGFAINIVLYYTHVSTTPLSLLPLLISTSIAMLVLCVAAFFRGAFNSTKSLGHECFSSCNISPLDSTVLISLPALGIIAGLMFQFYASTLFSVFLSIIIVLIVCVVGLRKGVPDGFFPVLIFSIGAALQFSRTFTGSNLTSSDLSFEYYAQHIVQSAAYWNPNTHVFGDYYYSMLGSTILPTMVSVLSGLDATLIFKFFFPLLFALVPVGLYQIYRTQIGNKAAFFSAFFFISFETFFTLMPSLPRQEVATLFLVLLVLALMHKFLRQTHQTALVIIFFASIVVSHYGIAYLFLMFAAILIVIFTIKPREKKFVSPIMFILFVVVALSWYLYVSGGLLYTAALSLGGHVQSSIANDLFNIAGSNADTALALGLRVSTATPLHTLNQYLQIVIEVLIVLGVILIVLKKTVIKLDRTFFWFSIISVILLLASIAIPALALSLNINRIYSISLLFLSPFLVISLQYGVERALSYVKSPGAFEKIANVTVLLILIPYFLFNVGFFYEITEKSSNLELSYASAVQKQFTKDVLDYSYCTVFEVANQEVYGAQWIGTHTDNSTIYADDLTFRLPTAYGLIPPEQVQYLHSNTPTNGYIFLGFDNVWLHKFDDTPRNGTLNVSQITSLGERSEIYNNGGTEIFR